LVRGDSDFAVDVEYRAKGYRMSVATASYSVSAELAGRGNIEAVIDGQRLHATVIQYRGRCHVFFEEQSYVFAYVDPLEIAAADHGSESSLLAPMPGRVIAQMVEAGDRVEKGTPLLVLEAMKMECTIYAPDAGRVESFHFVVGDQVTEGVELLHFNREKAHQEES
jgi:3-methylcrotonyl-CoA carboxylase alpha subunit